LANWAELEPIGLKPMPLRRSLTSGRSITLARSDDSLAETSAGRFFGAHRPY
jgi:hypothetical protein